MKKLVLLMSVLSMNSLYAIDCEYTPFELKVAARGGGTRGTTRGGGDDEKKPKALAFAKAVVKDGKKVYSDVPFFAWQLDPFDSQLSKENTMLELSGYFTDFLKLSLPKDFMTTDTVKALEGLSAMQLVRYPSSDEEYDADIEKRIKNYFKDDTKKVLDAMKKKNGEADKSGIPHFTRLSYLSSKSLRDAYGDSVVLACMSIAYGIDVYKNPRLKAEEKKKLKSSGRSIMRNSILDYLASEAIQAKAKKRDPAGVEVMLGGGMLKCGLKKTDEYVTTPVDSEKKCESVKQEVPVVRGVEGEPDSRLVQVGDALYGAECKIGTKAHSLVTSKDFINMKDKDLLDLLEKGLNTKKGNALGDALKKAMPHVADTSAEAKNAEEAKTAMLTASDKCDEELTGAKAAKLLGAGPAQPRDQIVKEEFSDSTEMSGGVHL